MSVKGRQTACIFIHPVGGLIFAYSKLVKNLGHNRSCYGIQSLALAGLEAPKSIEQMAEAYSDRSEEHTSELQSLMRISYAVFCLKKKKSQQQLKLSNIL